VVLDLVAREPGRLTVLAADGLEARWLKNLLADPRCAVWHRGRRFTARASVSDADPGELAVSIYRQRPVYAKLIYLAIGERIRGEADVRRTSAGTLAVVFEEIPQVTPD
jgi:hypothetical protein